MDEQPRWYCIQIKGKEEESTLDSLKRQGYQVFLPMALPDKRVRKDRKEKVPLFPGYGFIYMERGRDEFRPVANTPGVLRIIRLTEKIEDGKRWLEPTPVPDWVIRELKQLESGGMEAARHDYRKGDKVRITSGPFMGYEAIVNGTAKERVEALLNFMGSQEIRLNYEEVEPV